MVRSQALFFLQFSFKIWYYSAMSRKNLSYNDTMVMITSDSAHYNLILQNASLKLPKAILSSDRTTHHAPRTTHHAPRTTNYTHSLNNRVNYLTADNYPLSVLFVLSFSFFGKMPDLCVCADTGFFYINARRML